jgi:hypothetical protein
MYYNVALRRVRIAVGAVEKQFFILCVSVDLVIQHAKRMRRIVICGPADCSIFLHIIS